MTRFRIAIALAALAACASIVPSAGAQVTPTVAVTGENVQLVGNDAALVKFTVSKYRPTRSAALAVTSRRIRAIINGVRRAGDVANSEISTGTINVHPHRRRNDEGQTVSIRHHATQRVEVTILNVKRTGRVVAAGVNAGATGVGGPQFFVSDPSERYEDALLQAFDQAKRKARALAERSGRRLGQVLNISEGRSIVFLERSSNAAAFQEFGNELGGSPPPVRSGKSRVRGVVSVVFELR